MKKLIIVFAVILSLLAGCSQNEPAPSPKDTGSDTKESVTASPLVEGNTAGEEHNAVDMDRIIEKVLKAWFETEKIEEYKYKCKEYEDILHFQKNSKGDYLTTIKDNEVETHEITFGVKNNIIDLSDKFKNDKNITLDYSIASYDVEKYDTSWPVSDITLKIKGNEHEESIKLRSCDGRAIIATDNRNPELVMGYISYILLVSSDGYVISDENLLYVTEVDMDGVGLNKYIVSHIIILPKDADIRAEHSDNSLSVQEIESELQSNGYTIYEKKTFIENGTEYLAVFIKKDEVYRNILIYDLLQKKSVFDLEQSEIPVPYVDTWSKNNDYFEIADKNNDGVKEIIFRGDAPTNSPRGVIMISKQKEGFGIIFEGFIDNYQFIELNGDNVKELYTNTPFNVEITYDVGFSTVYEFKNNKYVPSYELTRNYESRKTKEYEQEFKKKPNLETLDKLIYMYAYLGEKDKCIKLKESNKALIKGVDDPGDKDFYKYYVGSCETMADYYKERWYYLKIQGNINNLEKTYSLQSDDLKDIIYDDLDGDGKIEAVVSYRKNGSSYNFLIKENGNIIREYVLPGTGGYDIDSIKIVKFDKSKNKYIYVQIANGTQPLGCAVHGLRNNELVTLFNETNTSGAGSYSIYDHDKDGIYDELVSLLSGYGVSYHPMEIHYELKGDKFVESGRSYSLGEYKKTPEEVIFDYLDVLWLEKNYGSNKDTKERIKEILAKEGLRNIDVSEYVANLYHLEGFDVELMLKLDILKDTKEYKEFAVDLKKGNIGKKMTFCVRFNAGKWQIEDIRQDGGQYDKTIKLSQ